MTTHPEPRSPDEPPVRHFTFDRTPGYDPDVRFVLEAMMSGGVTGRRRPSWLRRLVAFLTRRPVKGPKTWTYTPPEPTETDE